MEKTEQEINAGRITSDLIDQEKLKEFCKSLTQTKTQTRH
jgi:hypothetical protein